MGVVREAHRVERTGPGGLIAADLSQLRCMVHGMATENVSVTLDEAQFERVRGAVRAGGTRNVPGVKQHAAAMSRSASQQITHWARIGRELESAVSVSHREIADVLTGRGSYDALSAEQQAVIRAGWIELLDARIRALDLAEEFAGQGRSYVELDESGQVVRRTP